MFINIVLLSVLFIGIFYGEGIPLLHGKQWRELVVFSVLLLAGFGLSLIVVLNLKVPNPTQGFISLAKLWYL